MKVKFHRQIDIIIFLFCIALLSSCNNKNTGVRESDQETLLTEEELYRPNFHFTPKSNWMNDPNGMFYKDGTYHLYFQYYPDDNVWGPMHWGHATSTNLIEWKEQPIALYPDSLGYIFSGSAVVDHNNTSGLGNDENPPVIAIFTYHDPKGAEQDRNDFQYQGIAFLNDNGVSWEKYEGNPVLPNPGIKDFRDPKVIWDESNEQWVMALAVYDEAQFFGSKDLINWTYLSSFGKRIGAHGGLWECPDFFPMRIGSTDETKWVLIQSLNPGSPNGGSGTQYFVGDFDGKQFSPDSLFQAQLKRDGAAWLDYGRDNYAGVTWSNIPQDDGRHLFIGWMSNWDYAQVVPTEGWRSSMTIARELTLDKTESGYLVKSFPVKEMEKHLELISEKSDPELSTGDPLPGTSGLDMGNIQLDLEFLKEKPSGFSFALTNDSGELLRFGYDQNSNTIYIDRTEVGDHSFSEKFANTVSRAPLIWDAGPLTLRLLIDKTSIELFANDGERVMTEIFFPKEPLTEILVEELQDGIRVDHLKVYQFQ